jgi:hypothetical protein
MVAVAVMSCGVAISFLVFSDSVGGQEAASASGKRTYENKLTPVKNPKPLLADNPEFVEPIYDSNRLASPPLLNDRDADLELLAWRYSYNARGYIQIPNRLTSADTAIIVVHPWGLEDGQGWRMPQPAGFVFGSPEMLKNVTKQIKTALRPFIDSLRDRVPLVMYSLPGNEDPIRRKMYRSIRAAPSKADRVAGAKELNALLNSFQYDNRGSIAPTLSLSTETPVVDYFAQFPGGDAGDHYNGPGYWSLPIPVCAGLNPQPDDVVIYDSEGYEVLRDFLKKQGIRHILLIGFATDMCLCETTAGYNNLRNDFNVFVVGDLTQATSQGNNSSATNTTAALSFASLKVLITQASWVKKLPRK